MTPRDPDATRARLLAAAIDEFSERGYAGARIDRIADRASANKRAIYDYYGDKAELFRVAVNATIAQINEAVAFSEDLPDYVGRLFDFHLAHPQPVRMTVWWNLEHRPEDPVGDLGAYREFVAKVDAVAPHVGMPAADLVMLLLSLASTWQFANPELLAMDGATRDDPKRIAQHRAVVVEAASRLLRG